MPAKQLRIKNRAAYFRKALSKADFTSERVLVRDAFEYIALWLRKSHSKALPYWIQSHEYYRASNKLDKSAAPLTLYYCYLNAIKTLLTVKNVPFKEWHGVTGNFSASKRSLANEIVDLKNAGIIAELTNFLSEPETSKTHTLKDILSNLPFIHRAFRHTYKSHKEQFIPIKDVFYRKHPTQNKIWLSAKVEGRMADRRTLERTLPADYEIDDGFEDACIIRSKKKVTWHPAKGASAIQKTQAIRRLQNAHKKFRLDFLHISSAPDLWYLKRQVSGAQRIQRQPLTLICIAMHRLSELARYDPEGLSWYFGHKENWLLSEFIELSPIQFIDEIACEMTGLEFGTPGIRPR